MLKITKVEMEQQAFDKIYKRLVNAITSIADNLNAKQYALKVFEALEQSFGQDFIIMQSSDIFYNIQAEPHTLVILMVDNIRVVAYKPKIHIQPFNNKYNIPNEESIKVFISDNKTPNVEELTVVKNTLLGEKALKDIKNCIAVYLNKNKEQEKYMYRFLHEIKPCALSKAGNGVYHLFLSDVKFLNSQIAEENNNYNDSRELKIELRLVKEKKTYMLHIFENRGKSNSFLIMCLRRWKEFLIYLFMFFIVCLISVCKDVGTKFNGADVQFICSNRYTLLFVFGISVVYLVVTKHRIRKAKISYIANKKFE